MIIKQFSRLMTMFTFMAAFMLLLSLPAAAAVQATDFSCHGVSLGDSDGAVIDAFGQPLFEKTVSIQGILVKECDFDGDFTIGFAVMTGKVIDITIKNQKYEARNGIRYGATSGLIQATYGKSKKRMIDGNMFYIYDNPKKRHEHLMLQVDSGDGHLMVIRITGLPIDDYEVQEMQMVQPDLFRAPEEQTVWFQPNEKEIDVSSLPKDKPVRLGGLTE